MGSALQKFPIQHAWMLLSTLSTTRLITKSNKNKTIGGLKMKKFQVLRKIGSFNATAVREFDYEADALLMATLLAKSEMHATTKYFVSKVITEIEK
jgi:hypothetical protein